MSLKAFETVSTLIDIAAASEYATISPVIAHYLEATGMMNKLFTIASAVLILASSQFLRSPYRTQTGIDVEVPSYSGIGYGIACYRSQSVLAKPRAKTNAQSESQQSRSPACLKVGRPCVSYRHVPHLVGGSRTFHAQSRMVFGRSVCRVPFCHRFNGVQISVGGACFLERHRNVVWRARIGVLRIRVFPLVRGGSTHVPISDRSCGW
jgi:hypothetical protein